MRGLSRFVVYMNVVGKMRDRIYSNLLLQDRIHFTFLLNTRTSSHSLGKIDVRALLPADRSM